MNGDGYKKLIIGLNEAVKPLEEYVKRFDRIGETATDENMGKTFEYLVTAINDLERAKTQMMLASAGNEERSRSEKWT